MFSNDYLFLNGRTVIVATSLLIFVLYSQYVVIKMSHVCMYYIYPRCTGVVCSGCYIYTVLYSHNYPLYLVHLSRTGLMYIWPRGLHLLYNIMGRNIMTLHTYIIDDFISSMLT